MSFLCVCPEKSLEFGSDSKLHRGSKEQYIRGVLESISFGKDATKTVMTLPGGGIVIKNVEDSPVKITIDEFSSTLSALTGTLQNYAYLVKKYVQVELNLPQNVTLEAIRERKPISEAELLCKLYSQMGTGMVSKLRGQFSFCIYDATTVRVLAGRDCSGTYPLFQGKLSDNSLFIASHENYPTDAHQVEEIPAGCYKYGWHAGPIRFANPESEVRHTAEEASSAADAALAGLFCKTMTDKQQSSVGRRFSLDSHKPQRGKSGSRRTSLDNSQQTIKTHRLSLDSAVSSTNNNHNHTNNNNKTRADNDTWWRSNTTDNASTKVKSHKRRKNKRSSNNSKSFDHQPRSVNEPVQLNPVEELLSQLGGSIGKDSSSLRMLMKLLEDSPCSLVVTDAKAQDQLLFVNKSFEDQTGYKSEDVLGKNCRFLQAPPGGSIIQSNGSKALHKAIKEGHSCSVRLVNYKKDGCPMLTDCSIVPLRDSEGKITHHVGMHTFIPLSDDNTTQGGGEITHSGAQGHNQMTTRGGPQSILFRSRSCGDVASIVDVTTAPTLSQKDALFV
eukprot:g3727.t1